MDRLIQSSRPQGGGKDATVTRYLSVLRPDHPLAFKDGKVYVHQIVLYEKIGDGTHPCNWCGKVVSWLSKDRKTKLTPDHLNNDKWDNSPDNLVPSCWGCNGSRRLTKATHCKNGHLWTPDNTYLTPRGSRMCRTCARLRDARRRNKNKQMVPE